MAKRKDIHQGELEPLRQKFATVEQVCHRYGDRSRMWLHRRLKSDPKFPRPVKDGRNKIFVVDELDQYDRELILQRSA